MDCLFQVEPPCSGSLQAGPHICVPVCLLLGFPGSSADKEFACNEADLALIARFDPLEKGTATNSSILAWRISWTVYVQSMGPKKLDMTEQLSLSFCLLGNLIVLRNSSLYLVQYLETDSVDYRSTVLPSLLSQASVQFSSVSQSCPLFETS